MGERKRCRKCGRLRLVKFFFKNRKRHDGLQSQCKSCCKLYPSYGKCAGYRRENQLKHRSGLALEEYQQILEFQDFKCGACGRHQSEFTRNFHVDHCHRTGIVRGLLCGFCNRFVIGRHQVEWLRGGVRYLEEPPALKVIGEKIVPKRRKRGKGRRPRTLP